MNRFSKTQSSRWERTRATWARRILGAALFFSGALLAGFQTARAEEEPRFDYEYRPVALPERSAPKWALMQRAGTATVEEGKLIVHVAAGNRHYYAIGADSEGAPFGDVEAWSLSGGKMTVDFRLKVRSAAPEVEAFRVSLSDGELYWPIIFRQGEVEKKPLPVGEADTYRITLDDGRMVFSSERHGIIKERRKGISTGSSSRAMVYFGSFATNKEWPMHHGAAIDWELEFFRWTPAVLPPLGE